MGPRLADIARHAGVSEATVSRVLNDKPGVGSETRKAVLTALDVLGYERPARLRQRSAGLVGMVIPELDNPVFPMFAQAAEGALAQRGYTPVLCTQTPGGITEDEYVELLLERNVSGILFVSGKHADTTASHERYRSLVSRRLPIVLVNGFAQEIPAAFISCDDREAGRLAVDHLVALGHTRIGFTSGPERYVPVRRKLEGYHAALRDHGLNGSDLVELSLFGVEGGHAAATRLIDRGVTAEPVVRGMAFLRFADPVKVGLVLGVAILHREVIVDDDRIGKVRSLGQMQFTADRLSIALHDIGVDLVRDNAVRKGGVDV
jgi:DNA-binding LacI/PurR family transcriptional regulator